jgi:hypothetical protein
MFSTRELRNFWPSTYQLGPQEGNNENSNKTIIKVKGKIDIEDTWQRGEFCYLSRNIFFNFCDMIQEDVCISYMRGAGTFSTLELGRGFLPPKMLFILLFTNAWQKS